MNDSPAASGFSVAVVGFGAIGAPMAQRLAAHGHTVRAVDPNPDARARAAGAGLAAVAELAALPTTDVVLVLVATGEQLLQTAKAACERRRDGETWIISSTTGPQAARDAAALLAEAGTVVIDAPVTGGVPGAERGQLRFLTAGPDGAIDDKAAIFAALGTVVRVSERPGDGQSTKLVNQLCSSVHLAAAAEAVALASRLGLDPAKTVEVISGGSGASWFFDERGPRMARPDDQHDVLTRLAILAKDNGLVEQEAETCQAHVPLLKAAKSQYARAAELGLLEHDDSMLVRTYLS